MNHEHLVIVKHFKGKIYTNGNRFMTFENPLYGISFNYYGTKDYPLTGTLYNAEYENLCFSINYFITGGTYIPLFYRFPALEVIHKT